MSNNKHTPGPWHLGIKQAERIVYNSSGWAVANATVYHGKEDDETCKANARLIAAAPELLHAAMNVVWKLSHNHLQADGTTKPGTIDRNDAVVRLCMEAIAKAEGK